MTIRKRFFFFPIGTRPWTVHARIRFPSREPPANDSNSFLNRQQSCAFYTWICICISFSSKQRVLLLVREINNVKNVVQRVGSSFDERFCLTEGVNVSVVFIFLFSAGRRENRARSKIRFCSFLQQKNKSHFLVQYLQKIPCEIKQYFFGDNKF